VVARALRLLRHWQSLTTSIQLQMAPPEKRNIGTWVPWLGVLLCAGLGLVVVPKAKLLRTTERLRAVLDQPTEFSEYRSLTGMLEHLRCVNCAPASVMYGLYAPHGSKRVQWEGPATIINVTPFMTQQLLAWVALTARSGAASVTAVLTRLVPHVALRTVISSDAATDSSPPGMGGYCHGLYWYLEIQHDWLQWIHITAWELLATGGSAMAFERHCAAADRVLLQSDALATPYVLSRHKTSSASLGLAHHLLLQQPAYRDLAWVADIAHLFGDCNPFSDAVSRSLWDRFAALCRSVGIRPVQVETPPQLLAIIQKLLTAAKARGQPIRETGFKRPAPVLPPAMLGLGRRTPACEEGRKLMPCRSSADAC
jgi:hypothetical protein